MLTATATALACCPACISSAALQAAERQQWSQQHACTCRAAAARAACCERQRVLGARVRGARTTAVGRGATERRGLLWKRQQRCQQHASTAAPAPACCAAPARCGLLSCSQPRTGGQRQQPLRKPAAACPAAAAAAPAACERQPRLTPTERAGAGASARPAAAGGQHTEASARLAKLERQQGQRKPAEPAALPARARCHLMLAAAAVQRREHQQFSQQLASAPCLAAAVAACCPQQPAVLAVTAQGGPLRR